MKKILFYLFILVILGCIVLYVYSKYPKDISRSLEGIEYPIGSNTGKVNTISIHIEGKMYHSFFGIIGEEKFGGQIYVEGASYYLPPENTKTVIRFDKKGRGHMHYVSEKTGLSVDIIGYGILYTNRHFSKVTIAEARKDKNGRSWLSSNGWMITAPANSKGEALKISNELMKNVLYEKLK